MANTYGLTWGQIKEACRQNITQIRLPISEFDEVVFTALQQTARYYNVSEQPQFRRWNGADYNPEKLTIANFPIQSPLAGIPLSADADLSMDNPVYKVYSGNGQTFSSVSYQTLTDERIENVDSVAATDVADGIEYLVTATDVADGLEYFLIAEEPQLENVYAVDGNVLYVYPAVTVTQIYYSYYFTPEYPASDSTIVRAPQSILPLLVLVFRQMYLARFGQVLDAQSKRTLDNLLRAIAQG